MRATTHETTNTRPTWADRPADGFRHAPVGAVTAAGARKVYALGQQLGEDCPGNDCRVYLNTFHMAQELDEALDTLEGYPAQVMERELRKLLTQLWEMYLSNYAVRKYREGRPDKGTTPPEGYTGGELTKACWQRLMRRERETKTLLKALSAPLSAEGSQ